MTSAILANTFNPSIHIDLSTLNFRMQCGLPQAVRTSHHAATGGLHCLPSPERPVRSRAGACCRGAGQIPFATDMSHHAQLFMQNK